MKNKIAIYPGSFDPFTLGHKDIVERTLQFVDHIIIGIGVNSSKSSLFSTEDKILMIQEVFKGNNNVTILSYEGLTVDFVKQQKGNIIIRGIRNVSDFEYERNIADMNWALEKIETVILLANPKYSSLSSSIVRELIKHKKDISQFLPIELNNNILIKQCNQ